MTPEQLLSQYETANPILPGTPVPVAGPTLPVSTPVATPASSSGYGVTTTDPAQMLKNQQALVAGSNGTLKLVNGQVVSANSTLGQLSTVPNSPATSVSSSSTALNGLASVNAVNGVGAAPPTTNTDQQTLNTWASNLLSQYQSADPNSGYTLQGILGKAQTMLATGNYNVNEVMDALTPSADDLSDLASNAKTEQTELATQAASFAATNAANASDFASASAILAANQKATSDYVTGALRVGGQASASNVASVTAQVNQQYSALATQLAAKKAEEDDAAAAGNYDAVNKIQASYQTTLSDGLKAITQNMQSTISSIQSAHSLAASKQDAARTQVTSMANSMNLSSLVAKKDDGSIDLQATMDNIENSPLYAAGQTAGYTDNQLLGLVTTGTISGQNLNINTAKLGISAQQLSVSQFNAQVNASRANLESMTTATTVNTALGNKATQYSGYLNAAQGLASLQQSISTGQGGTNLTDALNSIIKNPDSAYADLASALGVNGTAILTAAFGHAPTNAEVQALVATAGKGPNALNNLLSSLGHSVATSIANATAVDSASPVPGMPISLISQVQSLIPNLQNIAPSSTSSGSSSGFGAYLNQELGGNYNINI